MKFMPILVTALVGFVAAAPVNHLIARDNLDLTSLEAPAVMTQLDVRDAAAEPGKFWTGVKDIFKVGSLIAAPELALPKLGGDLLKKVGGKLFKSAATSGMDPTGQTTAGTTGSTGTTSTGTSTGSE